MTNAQSLIIREIQAKSTTRYPLIPGKIAVIKKAHTLTPPPPPPPHKHVGNDVKEK
jgi:hypothetical protein